MAQQLKLIDIPTNREVQLIQKLAVGLPHSNCCPSCDSVEFTGKVKHGRSTIKCRHCGYTET